MAELSTRDNQWLLDLLLPRIHSGKQRRKAIEDEWLRNYRAWQGWPSQVYFLPLADNAVHYFIPHARRNVEKRVKRIKRLLTSSICLTEVIASDDSIPYENAESVQTTIDYIVKKKIPYKRNISQLARVTLLYNFPILHTSVVIQNGQVWPYQRVVDPYSFYIYPDTCLNLEDATLLVEETIIPYEIYLSYVDKDKKKSLFSEIDPLKLHVPEWPYHLVERIAYRGLTLPSDFNMSSTASRRYVLESDVQQGRDKAKTDLRNQAKYFVQLYKCYFRLASQWFYCVIANNLDTPHVVRLDEEENAPTYRWTNTRSLPGELYTNSEFDDIRELQDLSNTALSQMESQRSAFAEPPIGVDTNAVGRLQEYTFGNRKFWKVDGNPRDIFFPIQVGDNSRESMIATQIYMQLIDKNSGGDLAEGTPGRNMPRSGEASQNLLTMAMIEDEDIADVLEEDILSPSIGDIYHNILEYVPVSQLFKIPNKNPNLVKAFTKLDLEGDYAFNWLGAKGFEDQQVKADRFIQFAAMLLNPNLLPVIMEELALQGKKIDIVTLIKTVYSYGLGYRGLSDIIVSMTPQEQQLSQKRDQQKPDNVKLQLKAQESQNNMQLARIKGMTSVQDHQLKLEGHKLDYQGKVLDLAMKQKELQKKDIEHKQSHVELLKSMLEDSAFDEKVE